MKKDSTNEDSLLIQKAQAGNEGAFNFLMNKYYPRVYASLYSYHQIQRRFRGSDPTNIY